MTTLTIRIDERLKRSAARRAERLGIPLTLVITNALREFSVRPEVHIGRAKSVSVTPAIQSQMDQISVLLGKKTWLMELIISKYIEEKEYAVWKQIFPLEVIKEAARQVSGGLGNTIKNSEKIKNTVLKKIDLTSSGGAGRAIFLLVVGSGEVVLTMLRPKNDKRIGQNMSVDNPYFKVALEKHLARIATDLEQGNFERIPI